MSNKICLGVIRTILLVLLSIWIGAFVPEIMDAQIIPKIGGPEAVWWGFPWILTVIAMIAAAFISGLKDIVKCSEGD